ncbi:UDP-N-acetylmuramoyl-L-alanine--D-glutamate ligase [Chromobacterium piscinae]|uniref:UDP-N-acetylmuramoylalanine--D-glutamate ligase n=1 Tax=Chromobacterium piscinae TaxID=686831 RepID=A0ABV0H633_9NEIS|nr:UDP-N-acetylmuramoyl-L-alanine--D-glutamate ligase [Chromobacterium piscinae]MBX9349384.1 UDP-N-acetylmuramoyl-L-alanine--D-glutamate ligase [Chromobacterium vaccinii]MCD4504568.1 UDP-N-acetylmuramoyl-L-alanine--D-glutamate ligase [Chromobacterium piscinae]MCD5327033.1 UDP-N-acetylmuramoyl-L-alanine--D-glutamate ligase [Chromobacterium piscinae]NHQ82353.1 UDP-N-acetylmuramoyl-L-alanine--D-glutamate ligase [Chromobacterium vaccinii]
MDYANRHVTVVGLGGSGLAAARYLAAHGARVRVADANPSAERLAELERHLPGVEVIVGVFDDATFAGSDLLVVSPGVPLANPAIAAFRRAGGEAVGDIEILARAIQGDGSKVIAITGSNGKSTVTSLVGHLCEAAGLDTVVAGNIGLAVLEAQLEREQSGRRPDVWVLELSSFQLESTLTLEADAATVLNISEDHLDRYQDLLDYAHAKTRVFNGKGAQILNKDDALVRAMIRPGHPVKWFSLNGAADYALARNGGYWLNVGGEKVFDCADMQLQGLHNAANALAALALCQGIGLPLDKLLEGLKTFRGLAHRVELVDEFDSVAFIDDSKGTNVGATEAALNGMTRRVVLIAGGDGKGQDFAPLKPACQRIARAVLLIGRDAGRIEAALADSGLTLERCDTLEEATRRAAALARPGDVVLLSPACASLDMFKNYAHRAQVFIDTVAAVKAARA